MKADAQSQNWLQLASIQMGGVISLPLLFIGYELAKICHPLTAFVSILLGNILLFGISLISGWLSIRKKANVTVQNTLPYFGKVGRTFFAFVFSLSMLVWFAVQSQAVGGSVHYLIDQFQGTKWANGEFTSFIFSILIAAAVIASAFFDVKMLMRVAMVCLPVMVISIGYFIIQAGTFSSTVPFIAIWSGQAISLVLVANIAGIIDLPTFYRHARTYKDTVFSSILTFLVTVPIIEYLGACLYYSFSAPNMYDALVLISSPDWKNWTILFIVLTGWTTNNLNLYSAATSLKVCIKKFAVPQAVGVVGLIGIILITVPILDRFSSLLNLMGVLVVSMGSIILTAFMFEEYGVRPSIKLSWVAWCCGSGLGLLEMYFGQFGTGAIILDAAIVASLVLVLAHIPAFLTSTKPHSSRI